MRQYWKLSLSTAEKERTQMREKLQEINELRDVTTPCPSTNRKQKDKRKKKREEIERERGGDKMGRVID